MIDNAAGSFPAGALQLTELSETLCIKALHACIGIAYIPSVLRQSDLGRSASSFLRCTQLLHKGAHKGGPWPF